MTGKLTLVPGREKSLLRHHPWIFSKGVANVKDAPEIGGDIDIYSADGEFLARASFSPKSQIRARVWSFDQEEINEKFFEKRIIDALKSRETLIHETGTTAYRLIDAESDFLPGLIIDRYNNFLVLQVLSAGAEYHLKDITAALHNVFPDDSIYERSDESVRAKEGLEERTGVILGDEPPAELTITENNGIQIIVDIVHGHKTGYYLDQRTNRAAIEKYCDGKNVLNCFSYTGGFCLYALRGHAKAVTNVDVSGPALDIAKRNVALNHLDPGRVKFIKEDVFDFLRNEKKMKHTYDCIILDPPKFAENQSQVQRACRGYKDINMIAAELLNPNGVLMTFSCSGHIEAPLFQKVVADAFLDAKRQGRIIEFLTQAGDHPTALPFPEGLYLKGLVVKAD